MKKKSDRANVYTAANDLTKRIKDSIRFIRSKTKLKSKIAIILGSGLGDFAEALLNQKVIETNSIPHYPHSTVEGHRGKLILGKIESISILAFQGRVHFYETGNLETVLYPIRVAHALGVRTLIITNAAGGINEKFRAGDLMMITDQINLTFENSISNLQSPISNRKLYDKDLQNIITAVAKEYGDNIQRGIYCGVKGPSYETAAEIEMIRRIGGDAVGMSTVNEVLLACALGMRIAGISCITNLATGISGETLSHEEVTDVANSVKQKFAELISGVVKRIHLR